ncbi:MAG: hypothetical protein OXC26_20335 [Albidovulum sp.]|nr:hypothetical protein [Albidovulum sp.]
MSKPKERPTVRVKPHSYQPSKAELEEPFVVRKRDGSIPMPGELVRTALRPMNVIEDPDA